jgi:hypothetical protein
MVTFISTYQLLSNVYKPFPVLPHFGKKKKKKKKSSFRDLSSDSLILFYLILSCFIFWATGSFVKV